MFQTLGPLSSVKKRATMMFRCFSLLFPYRWSVGRRKEGQRGSRPCLSPERKKEQVFESPMGSRGIRLLPLVLQSGSHSEDGGFFVRTVKNKRNSEFWERVAKGSSRFPFSTVRTCTIQRGFFSPHHTGWGYLMGNKIIMYWWFFCLSYQYLRKLYSDGWTPCVFNATISFNIFPTGVSTYQ